MDQYPPIRMESLPAGNIDRSTPRTQRPAVRSPQPYNADLYSRPLSPPTAYHSPVDSAPDGTPYFQDGKNRKRVSARLEDYSFGTRFPAGENNSPSVNGGSDDGKPGYGGGYGDSKYVDGKHNSTTGPNSLPYAPERLSFQSTSSDSTPTPTADPTPPSQPRTAIKPTFALLFSLTPFSTNFAFIAPAVFLSALLGGIPPYSTYVIGNAFQAFADYTIATANPLVTEEQIKTAKSVLLSAVGTTSIQFTAIAIGALACSACASTLWTINGERTTRALRLIVFKGIGARSLAWFDMGMGAERREGDEEGDIAEGAGGLMGRFTKQSDEIRVATSKSMGLVIQYAVSFVACLGVSFYRDYLLTFVILASVPLMVILVGITENYARPWAKLNNDRAAQATSRMDRILGAMPTVKAFNAEEIELNGFEVITQKAIYAYNVLHVIWGVRQSTTKFIMQSMFVQGFWFGEFLIKSGRSSPAAVNTCFWACILASSFVQLTIPMLIVVEKGKVAMANLLELSTEGPLQAVARPQTPLNLMNRPISVISEDFRIVKASRINRQSIAQRLEQGADRTNGGISPSPSYQSTGPQLLAPTSHPRSQTPTHFPTFIPLSSALHADTKPTRRQRNLPAPRELRKLRPSNFNGEISFKDVFFHYPTRPHPAPPALEGANIYIAAKETTFIVGGSGSGKSTVGNLLLGLYQADEGLIEFDEQPIDLIDHDWIRGHVALVSQGASVIFDGSVHDNVAIGVIGQLQANGTRRRMEDVTREEVISACRGALMHEFIRDLPEGYDTWLSGEKGASLSGGQRQRLAIARAWMRDPTVLILDEATSALDATSRLLVGEAIKQWRKNKTTIIITHDLSPIGATDFVYVLAEGCVVEQGYREDLEMNLGGNFYTLSHSQQLHGHQVDGNEQEALEWEFLDEDYYANISSPEIASPIRTTFAMASGLLPAPTSKLTQAGRDLVAARHRTVTFNERAEKSRSVAIVFPRRRSSSESVGRRPSAAGPPSPRRRSSAASRFTPAYDFSHSQLDGERRPSTASFVALDRVAGSAALRRHGQSQSSRIKHKTMAYLDPTSKEALKSLGENGAVVVDVEPVRPPVVHMSLKELTKIYYPTIPSKISLWIGLFLSLFTGGCTPVFSYLLAKLMSNLGKPNAGSVVTVTSLLILLLAAVESIAGFFQYYFLEACAEKWITGLRRRALALVLKQDKTFLDRPENSSGSLVNTLTKDADDTRDIVGTLLSSILVVFAMIVTGIVWALSAGWELSLVGLGFAPVFVLAIKLQTAVLTKYEASNKLLREDVSKKFHQNVANVRAIRSMAIESVFIEKFKTSIDRAYVGAIKIAPLTGVGFALGASLGYLAQALLFYVGAVLIALGRYNFEKVLTVFTMIIFSITFASQIMSFLPAGSKSVRASIDLWRLLSLSPDTAESEGRMTFPITGSIAFDNVEFAYPQRPQDPVLNGVTFEVHPGECVGIVGASGSGKSTITALLQRLYEPSSGSIFIDGRPLSRVDVKYLRDHVAIVSQHPSLFDMTVAENISYGCEGTSEKDIIKAATAAHVHDFITTLPKGYQTHLGDSASLISGGQAQRLQIARALLRHREILILDECTSALDAANQEAVMETIMDAKRGKTTIIVTHKASIMERCDRLIVMDSDGRVAETGTFNELRFKAGGLFASLASGGEWESS